VPFRLGLPQGRIKKLTRGDFGRRGRGRVIAGEKPMKISPLDAAATQERGEQPITFFPPLAFA